MQPTGGGGLTRFRSTPANWIESFLLKEEDEDESESNLSFTQLLSSNAAGPSTTTNSVFATQQYYASPLTPTSSTANASNPFSQVLLPIYFISLIYSLSILFIFNCCAKLLISEWRIFLYRFRFRHSYGLFQLVRL